MMKKSAAWAIGLAALLLGFGAGIGSVVLREDGRASLVDSSGLISHNFGSEDANLYIRVRTSKSGDPVSLMLRYGESDWQFTQSPSGGLRLASRVPALTVQEETGIAALTDGDLRHHVTFIDAQADGIYERYMPMFSQGADIAISSAQAN